MPKRTATIYNDNKTRIPLALSYRAKSLLVIVAVTVMALAPLSLSNPAKTRHPSRAAAKAVHHTPRQRHTMAKPKPVAVTVATARKAILSYPENGKEGADLDLCALHAVPATEEQDVLKSNIFYPLL